MRLLVVNFVPRDSFGFVPGFVPVKPRPVQMSATVPLPIGRVQRGYGRNGVRGRPPCALAHWRLEATRRAKAAHFGLESWQSLIDVAWRDSAHREFHPSFVSRRVDGGGSQSAEGDGDEPLYRRLGPSGPGRRQSVEAVAGELVGWDVGSDLAPLRGLVDQVR
jgi:hypothetical protein